MNNQISFEEFLSKFNFRKQMTGLVGIERERFLKDSNDLIVPRSQEFLLKMNDNRWTYELSACQVEDRTNPCKSISKIEKAMTYNDGIGHMTAKEKELFFCNIEVADENMPLDIYPNPRYIQIASQISRERLSAACRVAGTHLHFGMPDLESSIRAANLLREKLDYFCSIGDHSHGERLRLYKIMAQKWEPPYYESTQHFFEIARKEGFVENPRECWNLIRISIHGSIELRMFGSTEDTNEICHWIELVKKIIFGD